MNVYGITFSFSTNYGTLFQSYALQTAIETLRIHGEKQNYKLIRNKDLQGSGRTNEIHSLKALVIYMIKKLHRIPMAQFETQYMHYEDIASLDQIADLNFSADAFVCGSDSIWDPSFNHNLGCFYLDFAKKYAFSFAPSFGRADIPENLYREIGQKLSHLKSISVREKQSRDIVQKCISETVDVCVDPVLLLNAEEWNKVAEPQEDNKKYILAYTTSVTRNYLQFLKKLSKQTGLQVVYTAANPQTAIKLGILHYHRPGQWLQLLRDAQYVVTSSFHGTVFSIIFHKNFYSIGYGKNNEANGYNMRMNDILKEVGLQNRFYFQTPEVIDLSGIDYKNVDKKIDEMKRHSIDFLEKNLEAAYEEKCRTASSETL